MAHSPLHGYRVFDITQATAGPFCAAQLSDFGAEVIHIERPEGDTTRRLSPSFDGTATTYLSYNRNKKSVVLDLKTETGRRLARQLLEQCDILVENNRPGVMKKLGLSYEEVRKIKPDIIYASLSGFGQTGPYSPHAAYDGVIQAMSGFMSLTGEEGEAGVKAGPSLADLISGLYAAMGILVAVIQRQRTGEGTHLDCSMLDTFTAMMENPIAAYLNAGEIRKPMGNKHPQSAIFGPLPAKDGSLMVCMQKEAQHQKFCELMGLPDITQDPRFNSSSGRRKNLDALMKIVEPATRRYTQKELREMLLNAGLAAGEINTIPQVVEDPHFCARNNIIPITDPKNGTFRIYGQPLKFSNIDVPDHAVASQLGADTKEVLMDWLGMSEAEAEQAISDMQSAE